MSNENQYKFFFDNSRIYDFMAIRKYCVIFSMSLIILSVGSFFYHGMVLGLDFTGGTVIEVGYEKSADLDEIREALKKDGFSNPMVQNFGSDKEVLIRLQGESSNQLGQRVMGVLENIHAEKVVLRRVEFVGSQVGEELKFQAIVAILIALFAIMLYLSLRFQMKFAIAAVIATLHDVIITIGCFAFFGWEFDLTVLAAVLAVLGYSLNDTIVVFDRIRENFIWMRKSDVGTIINTSVSETLSRTVVTSVVTLLTVLALFFTGGETLRGFSLALIIGITIGTFSSIYVASAYLYFFKASREDLVPPEKEKEEYDTP